MCQEKRVKVFVGFSGCKVNQFEKNFLSDKFLQLGFHITKNPKDADVIVFNTCCVTKKAEKGCRQMISHFHRENPFAKIVVTGCMAEKEKEALLKLPFVHSVYGNYEKNSIPEFIAGVTNIRPSSINFEYYHTYKDRNRAVLKIQDGCDSFCSYCIVPFLRGKPVSMSKELVLKNLWHLKNENEVILTGIHLGKWGKDFGDHLVGLVKAIAKEKYPFRIRLSSLDPMEIDENLLLVLKDMENFCPHFHISLQSGSDKVLSLMNRKYTTKEFLLTLDLIKKHFPLAGIGIDIITAFPGEDLKSFEETEKIIKKAEIDYMHIFPYSKREGTKAYHMTEEVEEKEKMRRVKILKQINIEKKANFVKRFINKEIKCIKDKKEGDIYRAVSREYLKVYLKEYPGEKEFSAILIEEEKPIAVKT